MTNGDRTGLARRLSTADALAHHMERIAVAAVALTARALAEADGGADLTFPQWRAVVVLGERPDGARIGEVAARVGVTIPATSRLLRRLERRGLVALGVDEQDRRATRARLTDSGVAVRAAILSHRQAVLREVVASLSDPARLDLASGLAAIAAELDRFA
jgi:DNA-binding MarR family transcriptional regulator